MWLLIWRNRDDGSMFGTFLVAAETHEIVAEANVALIP